MPGTAGDTRTVLDVALYLGFLASVLVAIVAPPARTDWSGPALLVAPIVLLVAVRPAGQDDLPGRPVRAVPARPGLLRHAGLRRHDRRAEAAHLRGVDRRRRVEVREALLQRGRADDVATARACCPGGSSGPSTATSPTTSGRPNWPAPLAHVGGTLVEIATPLVLLFSTNRTVTLSAVAVMVAVPPLHHLDVPTGRAAGVERAVRLRHRVPVLGLPGLGRVTAWATCRRRG